MYFATATRRLVILTMLLTCVGFSIESSANDIDQPVTLREEGDTVILSNGKITAHLKKSRASLQALRYREFDMLKTGYYSMDGGSDFVTLKNCHYFVTTESEDLVDVGMRRTWTSEPQAFDIEVHYVLRRGDTGIYCYAVLDHPAEYPTTSVGEWRYVWKLSSDLLPHICVDEQRTWQMQSSQDTFEPTPIREIIKLTSGVRAGQYACKYDFNAEYHDLGCWGHASDSLNVGAWIVLGSHEYFNDGPTKQDLTAAHNINHLHFGMNHYNSSSTRVAAGQAWRKLYGPFLLYCNHAEGGVQECWADARERARRDQQAWPYDWLKDNADYPLAAQRGSVTGQLVVTDRLKPTLTGAGARVGLAQPGPGGNWQFDSMSYQYWTEADSDGRFLIPHVRPGTYTLYALVEGAVGEFETTDVQIEAGRTLNFGKVVWDVPHHGTNIAWEIGVADRTAREFRFGNEYFHGYKWKRIPEVFPNPLEYTIGRSNWSSDWCFAHTRYPIAGGEFEPHTWRIHFDLPQAPNSTATLTLAIASADRANIRVSINDARNYLAEVSPSIQGGNALMREGIHAKFCVEYVTIPPGHLRAGSNTITLKIPNTRLPKSHVMYDYISLEL